MPKSPQIDSPQVNSNAVKAELALMRFVVWSCSVFRSRIGLCVLAACLIPQMRLMAQRNMAACVIETKDQIPPDQLPAPARMTGVGNVHMEITAKPEAQMWFDQGLNLLHDFWDYESARAFEQAIRIDPKCAMCYWGLYKAESFYHSNAQGYAAQALARAVSLEGHASRREQLYIQASVAHMGALKNTSHGPSRSRELDLWRRIVREYPKDLEARIFLAGLVDHDETLELLESVLRADSENSAANHAYIHALEPTDHPERALHSAEILARLAPASGHMVHMPGHIYFRIGDYARAEKDFAASMQVDERYMREQHVSPDDDWNYVHNLMYAIANFMEEGKLKKATSLSARLAAARGALESTLYTYSPRDSITRVEPRLPVALRTADWAQVLELLRVSVPISGHPNLRFLAQQLTDFSVGMQAVEAHDIAKAEEASRRFDASLWRISQPLKDLPVVAETRTLVMPDALLHPLLNSLSIMSLELRGSLQAALGQREDAKKLFSEARKQEKDLGYREPPIYIRPVAETEGAALMMAGDWAAAKAAYKQALQERPKSGFGLYGVALSSEKAGDAASAAKEYTEFLAAWKDADPGLPQIRQAEMYVAAHPQRARVSRSGITECY